MLIIEKSVIKKIIMNMKGNNLWNFYKKKIKQRI